MLSGLLVHGIMAFMLWFYPYLADEKQERDIWMRTLEHAVLVAIMVWIVQVISGI